MKEYPSSTRGIKRQQPAGMIDVSPKKITKRIAKASAQIQMSQKAFQILETQGSPKGDVFESARIAAIMAAKNTAQLIPYCHPLDISKVNIAFKVEPKELRICIFSEVVSLGRTGVEMEALTAVSIAALTIYDMMKWLDQRMHIFDIQLDYKSGGKSGTYQRA